MTETIDAIFAELKTRNMPTPARVGISQVEGLQVAEVLYDGAKPTLADPLFKTLQKFIVGTINFQIESQGEGKTQTVFTFQVDESAEQSHGLDVPQTFDDEDTEALKDFKKQLDAAVVSALKDFKKSDGSVFKQGENMPSSEVAGFEVFMTTYLTTILDGAFIGVEVFEVENSFVVQAVKGDMVVSENYKYEHGTTLGDAS